MNFLVPPKIIDETECDKSYSCVYGDAKTICEVEESIGEMIFMKCKDLKYCRHKTKLNKGFHKCECKVRQSIFKNYGE